VIAGAGALTLQFASDPDTLVYTPTSGDVTINGATDTNMMLDFVGFGGALTQQTLNNDTSSSGGNTFIKIGGSTIELTGFTGGIPLADETIDAECYRIGTRLATPDGAVAVEDLVVGDLLLTIDGEAMPVTWIGQRRIDCARHHAPDSVRPVRVAAHAFAENQPSRDLFLSPGHAVYSHGVLIPVKYLINGDSIARQPAREVTYFHVALPMHAVLLAEGLPAESYLDIGEERFFAGTGADVVPHPAWRRERCDVATIWETQAAAPMCMSGPTLARVRDHLTRRAAIREARSRHAVSCG
jgi:collagen type I/II/III/V/XI/XXIV/XXVII alpha